MNFASHQILRFSPERQSGATENIQPESMTSIKIESPLKSVKTPQANKTPEGMRRSPSESKFERKFSLIQDGSVNLNKFKIFFKAAMYGSKG